MFGQKAFKLAEHDAQSQAWKKLKVHLESQLATLRERNDKNKPEMETAFMRGQIAQLKYLLTLDQQEPAVAPEKQFPD